MGHQEIERKFLVETIPFNYSSYSKQEIRQGYISDSNAETEVRLRQKNQNFYLTVKTGEGIQRNEIELEISEEQFRTLWPATQGQRLEKNRFQIPEQGTVIELDIYHHSLKDLITAAVEFNSLCEAEAFKVPDWFGEEVTDDKRYKNKQLAAYGIPQKK